MATKFTSVCLFLLLLLSFQEMMPSEAALCEARSRLFHGFCIDSTNCLAFCEQEWFISGECKWFMCMCQKDCNFGGGGPPDQGGSGAPPPKQGGEPGEGPSPPPEQGGGEEPGEGSPPPEQGGGGEEPGASPPEQGGGGEEPVADPPKKGRGTAKPPLHSRKYLLPNN